MPSGLGSTFKLPGLVAYAGPQDKQGKQDVPKFDTDLTPEQTKQFLLWKAKNAPNDSGEDYDLRGAFLADLAGQLHRDPRGHTTDKFKKPNHPTFSTESMYSKGDSIGGRWIQKNGKTYFYASPANLKYRSAEELKKYFKENEPGVVLVLPSAK